MTNNMNVFAQEDPSQGHRERVMTQGDGAGDEGWLQLVPDEEKQEWRDTIARDVQRQEQYQARAQTVALAAHRQFDPFSQEQDSSSDSAVAMPDIAAALGGGGGGLGGLMNMMSQARSRQQQQQGARIRLHRPSSHSYSSGGDAKRRKIGGSADPNPKKNGSKPKQAEAVGSSLVDRLRTAVQGAQSDTRSRQGAMDEAAAAEQRAVDERRLEQLMASVPRSNLLELYKRQIRADLRTRAEGDQDYSPARFPRTAELIASEQRQQPQQKQQKEHAQTQQQAAADPMYDLD